MGHLPTPVIKGPFFLWSRWQHHPFPQEDKRHNWNKWDGNKNRFGLGLWMQMLEPKKSGHFPPPLGTSFCSELRKRLYLKMTPLQVRDTRVKKLRSLPRIYQGFAKDLPSYSLQVCEFTWEKHQLGGCCNFNIPGLSWGNCPECLAVLLGYLGSRARCISTQANRKEDTLVLFFFCFLQACKLPKKLARCKYSPHTADLHGFMLCQVKTWMAFNGLMDSFAGATCTAGSNPAGSDWVLGCYENMWKRGAVTTGVTNLWLLPGDESKLGEAPGAAKSPLCSGAIDVQRSKR